MAVTAMPFAGLEIALEPCYSFLDIFKEAGFDFYKIDPNIFAPAVVIVNNTRTGKSFRAGNLDIEVLKDSLGIA